MRSIGLRLLRSRLSIIPQVRGMGGKGWETGEEGARATSGIGIGVAEAALPAAPSSAGSLLCSRAPSPQARPHTSQHVSHPSHIAPASPASPASPVASPAAVSCSGPLPLQGQREAQPGPPGRPQGRGAVAYPGTGVNMVWWGEAGVNTLERKAVFVCRLPCVALVCDRIDAVWCKPCAACAATAPAAAAPLHPTPATWYPLSFAALHRPSRPVSLFPPPVFPPCRLA